MRISAWSSDVCSSDLGWAIFSASDTGMEAVEQQLADDWLHFLLARSSELREGAKLVGQFMGRGPDTHGFEGMANAFWESLAEMGREGLLSQKELLHMTAPSAGRSVEQIEEPFKNGLFAGLSLDHVSVEIGRAHV